MEGVATVEIVRSQIWQWLHHGTRLADGRAITRELVHTLVMEEIAKYRAEMPQTTTEEGIAQAVALFEEVSLSEDFPDFLTLPGYERLDLARSYAHD